MIKPCTECLKKDQRIAELIDGSSLLEVIEERDRLSGQINMAYGYLEDAVNNLPTLPATAKELCFLALRELDTSMDKETI